MLGLIWLCWAVPSNYNIWSFSAGQVFPYRVFTPQSSLMSGLKLDDNICKYAKDSGHMSEASDAFRVEENLQRWAVTCVRAGDSGLSHVIS